ncbi:hypothetical protein F503_06194 [Ophiostoma piceae UAMH 11346]|uniref:Uncharacterized protein n=1 Tax=Ophiostoma piceae (strain UAMH 11346) TaxID=1262450 RepID=S3CV62_OPHP1|nr:hypothetical protein F503_06194 [Ophiostoma piceae UAMH 11346]
MHSSTTPPLLFWATALFSVLGSVPFAHATPPPSSGGGGAESVAMAARHMGHAAPRFSPDHDKHIDLAAMPLMHRAAATNLQTFTGALASIQAAAISQSNDATRPFSVDGDTFVDYQTAAGRACDNQHNSCADAANSQKSSSFTVGDCDTQNTQCKSAASSATQTAFTELTSSTSDFEIFCDL